MIKLIAFGALGLVLVVLAVAAIFHWRWDHSIASEVAAIEARATGQNRIITGEMLAGLPHPVQRYLLNAGVIGKPIPAIVRLKQLGRIRSGPDADWMTFEAEETYSTSPPGFVWRTWLPGRGIPMVMGRDVYVEGRSSIVMRMLGLVPVANESGDEVLEAGLMRYLNEIMWFPMAYLSEAVSWEALDENRARVSVTDQGLTVSAILEIDDEGQLVNFTAERFNTGTGRVQSWQTPISRYAALGGLQLPVEGQGVWIGEEDDFAYIELEIVDVEFD